MYQYSYTYENTYKALVCFPKCLNSFVFCFYARTFLKQFISFVWNTCCLENCEFSDFFLKTSFPKFLRGRKNPTWKLTHVENWWELEVLKTVSFQNRVYPIWASCPWKILVTNCRIIKPPSGGRHLPLPRGGINFSFSL